MTKITKLFSLFGLSLAVFTASAFVVIDADEESSSLYRIPYRFVSTGNDLRSAPENDETLVSIKSSRLRITLRSSDIREYSPDLKETDFPYSQVIGVVVTRKKISTDESNEKAQQARKMSLRKQIWSASGEFENACFSETPDTLSGAYKLFYVCKGGIPEKRVYYLLSEIPQENQPLPSHEFILGNCVSRYRTDKEANIARCVLSFESRDGKHEFKMYTYGKSIQYYKAALEFLDDHIENWIVR